MHGGNDKYRRQQVERLEQAIRRLPRTTRIAVGGDWNFVMDTDRDIANATHTYGTAQNIGQPECTHLMAAHGLMEFFDQFEVGVRKPADLTWARGGKFSAGVVKRLDFWLLNEAMIECVHGDPRDALTTLPVWFTLPDAATGADDVDDDGHSKPGTDHSAVTLTFTVSAASVAQAETTRRIDPRTLATPTRLTGTHDGMQEQVEAILLAATECTRDIRMDGGADAAGGIHAICDAVQKDVWAVYESHAKLVKKERQSPSLLQ